ncbi:unnamed protein product [Owenia fusiformis]|uniref:Uncharacterized protein n=1 Tax=Owenia fusiformis TaxID=6347 RepID=A0A8J1U395_OWEFU|nr:unnamed protein product [Owenia fusiformis]
MSAGGYKLELDPPKRNIFVTQLHEREEDDEIRAIPIVKESAGQLIETGINSMQKTLLLKREVDVEKVHDLLNQKRNEFHDRMAEASQRQIEVQKKQQKMKDRVAKFEKFIKENEAKRRRAIQKYQAEVKLREQKIIEYEQILKELEEVRHRHTFLKRQLAKYKKYEEYLLKVIEHLPDNYLEVNDSMLASLMARYRTLSSTNKTLMDNLLDKSDGYDDTKRALDEMRQEHNKEKFGINNKLSHMQKKQEDQQDVNQQLETNYAMDTDVLRNQRTEFGMILMSIENLAEKCKRQLGPSIHNLTLAQKLDAIKEYVVERADIVKMSQRLKTSSPDPDRQRSGRKKRSDPYTQFNRVDFAD